VFAGWREMNDYMRDNKMEPVLPAQTSAPAESSAKAEEPAAADDAAKKAPTAKAPKKQAS
jgi:hypothetical protein